MFEEVKSRVSLLNLFEILGVKVVRQTALCPLHDDKKPSLSIDDKKSLWYCFVCNVGGDQITLVEKIVGVSSLDAARWINEKFGLGLVVNQKPKRNYYLEALNENYQILKDTFTDEFNDNCERFYPIQWALECLNYPALFLSADDYTFAHTYHDRQDFIESKLKELEDARYKLRRTAS